MAAFVRRCQGCKNCCLGGGGCGRCPQTDGVDEDLETVDRTPARPGERDLSFQRDARVGSHRARVLGVRSEVSISRSREERIAAQRGPALIADRAAAIRAARSVCLVLRLACIV